MTTASSLRRRPAVLATASVLGLLAGCSSVGRTASPTTSPRTTSSTSTARTSPSSAPSTSTPATGSTIDGGVGRSLAFERFNDCVGLLTYLQQAALARVGPYGLNGAPYGYALEDRAGMGAVATTVAAASAPVAAGAVKTADQSSSGTNTQEVGVDEGDLVENDGRYVYTVVDALVRVVDTKTGEQGSVLLPVSNGQPQLLLDGDRLVVAVGGWGLVGRVDERIVGPGWNGGSATTTVMVLDVKDRLHPSVLSTVDLEGELIASRASDGIVRLTLREAFGSRLAFVQPTRSGADVEAKAKKFNEEAIRASHIEDWLPRSFDELADGTTTDPTAAIDCGDVGRPGEFAGLGMTWIASIDPRATSPKVVGSAAVVAEGSTVYESGTHLYVTTTRWQDSTGGVQPLRPQPPVTWIHRFALSSSNATYEASGSVPGTLLSSYALSEQDDVLRVATTEQPSGFGRQVQSGVHTLHRTGDTLVELGSVTGLGKGEQIRAVRFIGSLAYVVTFRQTDPLYVVDLRDPAAPKVAGELHMNGYSAYLHPAADGFLLGIGQDATDTGRQLGTQLALYDVRDPAHPTRVAAQPLGSFGQSEAEFDPHAFLWWPADGTVVVPTNGSDPNTGVWRQAVSVLGSDLASITERGTLSHPSRYAPPKGSPGYTDPGESIRRSLIVDGRLVTVSAAGVLVSNASTLAEQRWVAFS
jgi:hypothetical protein